MRRKRKKIDWPSLKTAQRKTAAIAKILKRKPGASSTKIHEHFKGITREGLVTHCWRYGPKLPRAKAGPKRKSWPRYITHVPAVRKRRR